MAREPSPTAATLGARIRAAYLGRGLNRSEFQRALGVAYTTILHWERDEVKPQHDHLEAIAAVTGVPVEQLVGAPGRDPSATRKAVEAFLAGPDGPRVSPEQAQGLRAMDLGPVPATASMIRAIWLEWSAQLAATSEPSSNIRMKRRR